MEINEFIKNFGDQFDDTDISLFTPNTEFRKLDEWSSLMALSIIAMIDEEYDITLKGDDMQKSITINDLYNTVKTKI